MPELEKRNEDPLELELAPGVSYLAFDSKGGDDKAEKRNLVALEAVLDEVKGNVGIIVVGDPKQIRETLGIQQMSKNIKIVECDKQAGLGDGLGDKNNSMGTIAQLQRMYKSVVATYSNGSTAHNVSLSLRSSGIQKRSDDKDENIRLTREKGKRRPIIMKEYLPGVFSADNGAFISTTRQNYLDMLETLEGHNGRMPVMVFPDDEFPDHFLRDYLGYINRTVVEFDALKFLQSKEGLNMLMNGFIGNVHLKLIETFIKDKKGQNLSRKELSAISQRVVALNKIKGDKSYEWEIPELEDGIKYGILCNGTEEKKGTPQLQALNQALLGKDNFVGFVEPEALINNPDIQVLATPACVKLVESITRGSILQEKLKPWKWKELIELKQGAKKTAPIAEIAHLGKGRAFVGHGEAKTEATIQNLEYLFDALKQEN